MGGWESEEGGFGESCERPWLVANRATLPQKWQPKWEASVGGGFAKRGVGTASTAHLLGFQTWVSPNPAP